MLDKTQMMPFNFLSYGGVITGEQKGMRYRLRRVGEKPDFKLCAEVWPGPFGHDATPAEKITTESFPFSKEGREEAVDWMIGQYNDRKEEWDNIPSILNAKL